MGITNENNFLLFGIYFSEADKKGVVLNWSFPSGNSSAEEFIIKKSLDNKEFKIIGRESKLQGTHRDYYYLFIDDEFDFGNNYYRIFLRKSKFSKKTMAISNTITITVADKKQQTGTKKRDLNTAELVF